MTNNRNDEGWRAVERAVRESNQSLGGEMDGLSDKMDGLGEKMDGLGEKMDGLGEKMDGLGEKMDGLGEKIDRGFHGLTQTIAANTVVLTKILERQDAQAGSS